MIAPNVCAGKSFTPVELAAGAHRRTGDHAFV